MWHTRPRVWENAVLTAVIQVEIDDAPDTIMSSASTTITCDPTPDTDAVTSPTLTWSLLNGDGDDATEEGMFDPNGTAQAWSTTFTAPADREASGGWERDCSDRPKGVPPCASDGAKRACAPFRRSRALFHAFPFLQKGIEYPLYFTSYAFLYNSSVKGILYTPIISSFGLSIIIPYLV